jgi:hypothetical protein
MPSMKNQHIARLEAHLEQLIEGTFASLFGKKISAQDIALQLARAMEDALLPAQGGDPRLFAPNQYIIYLHPDVQAHLLEKYPELTQSLGNHMVELASRSGYRLNGSPTINLLADGALDVAALTVTAAHSERQASSTAAMQRVELPPVQKPLNPQFIINDMQVVPLEDDVINIGRSPENQIVLDDPYVSRRHIQLRLRYGMYVLFDVRSQGGTFVNGVQVKEHNLRSGDVIRIGSSHMLYLEDDPSGDASPEQTQSFDPL